jgi:ABC-2 type transport system ATP-binding protein
MAHRRLTKPGRETKDALDSLRLQKQGVNMPDVVVVNNLMKKYGQRLAVAGLSFSVGPGQTLGLLGPNGAGKTTTMRMLMGLSRPSSGSISIFGIPLANGLKQVHSRIGVVFEKPNLMENLSAYQNLALSCKLYGQPLSRIQSLLERMDLWSRARDPVRSYSKGMRQRILIIRALIHEPELLFLDEPCSGLDPVSSRIIRDYLLELKRGGITIILTSHDMTEVDELCDQIGFINHGELVVMAEPRELKERFGQSGLKVTFRQDSQISEAVIAPTSENLGWLAGLYAENRVVAVHSMEATLDEIFRKLSDSKLGQQPSDELH